MGYLKTAALMLTSLRTWLMQMRLKAAGRVFENLPFDEIKNKYIGRAVNFQPTAWRVIFDELGSTYTYYETVGNESKARVTSEGSRRVFLAPDAKVFSSRGVIYNPYYNC